MGHVLYAGKTGSGKNNTAAIDLFADIDEGKSVTAAFPKEKDGRFFVAQLYALHGPAVRDRLVVERIGDTDRVIMRDFIPYSREDDFWKRMQENEELGGNFREKLAMRRRMLDFGEHPVLDEESLLVTNVVQELKYLGAWMPDSEAGRVILPTSGWWHFALRNLKTDDLRRAVWEKKLLSLREIRDTVRPVVRLCDLTVRTPPARVRTCRPASWDKKRHHDEGKIYVILGGGASADAIRTFISADMQDSMLLARKGLRRRVVYFIDELNNFGLGGFEFLRHLSTMRDYGVEIKHCVQSFNYLSPDVTSGVIQNCDIVIHCMHDPDSADLAARILRGMYDRDKVHHTDYTTRQVHDGFDEVDDLSWTEQQDELGNKSGSGQRRGKRQVARYRQQTEARDVYESGHDQQFWQAADVQEFPVGTCAVKRMGQRPYVCRVPKIEDAWVFEGLWERKAHECIELLKNTLPIYETPVIVPEPPIPPPPPRPAPKQPTPVKPAARGRKPGR